MSALPTLLKQNFQPNRTSELDVTVEFNWVKGACRVGIHNGHATFYDSVDNAPQAELILFFVSEQQACDIISGRGNPIEAFMRGEFRSNGYLVWAFQTLAAFAQNSAG
jgi:putative sterol carrier protein